MFEKLQVVELREIRFPLPGFVNDLAHSISRCRYLQVLKLEFQKVDHSEIFITMANGCPLLRRFEMKSEFRNLGPEMTGDQFSRLLRALPRVELLSLSVRFRMTASELRDLANCCSRLKVLELRQTRLFLSSESLVATPSLSGLRELRLETVWFKNPSRYTQLRSLESIATEWSRVFPRLQRPPESPNAWGPEESDGDDGDWSTDHVSEVSPDDPSLDPDLNESESDCFQLSRRFWQKLGYDYDGWREVIAGTKHMWQTNFEIETFDWHITPMSAFLDPQTYSSVEAAEVLDLATISA